MTQGAAILEKKVTVQPDLVARNNDDGTIVVMRMDESNVFFKIDGVAALIWKGLNGQKPLKDIFVDLKTTFDVEESVLLNDLETFLTDLKSKDLIELS
jgi:hypothetical protein